jgi:succinate dehydrogenase flavin-adding protein (antitoxin of CptAB toxin-antitoxin module)
VDTRPALATSCEPPLSAGERPVEAGADARWLARLRWRCRRGMLENDLILERFLDTRAATLTAADVAALGLLLDYSDNDLWDILSGRIELADVSLLPLVGCLRSI